MLLEAAMNVSKRALRTFAVLQAAKLLMTKVRQAFKHITVEYSRFRKAQDCTQQTT